MYKTYNVITQPGLERKLKAYFVLCPAFANSVDPDQLASSEANWSGSTLFAIQYLNLYQIIWIK